MYELHSSFNAFIQYGESGLWISTVGQLLAAFVFGQSLSWTYETTYRGLSYSRGFGQSIILTALAAAILVMSMSHSIIAGIGLLGVLSMIRFRVTLKAPRDLVFILGAATIGVASGVNAMLVGTVGTISFCLVALYLHVGPFGSRTRFDGVLRFRVPSTVILEPQLKETLNKFCLRYTLLSISEIAQGTKIEHSYQIKFWQNSNREDLLSALREEFQAIDARLLLQEATLEY